MSALIEIISVIFMFIGSLFYLLGSLGIVRFPDLYTRLHASTKTVVIGACGIMFGAILLKGISAASAKSRTLARLFSLIGNSSPIEAPAVRVSNRPVVASVCV